MSEQQEIFLLNPSGETPLNLEQSLLACVTTIHAIRDIVKPDGNESSFSRQWNTNKGVFGIELNPPIIPSNDHKISFSIFHEHDGKNDTLSFEVNQETVFSSLKFYTENLEEKTVQGKKLGKTFHQSIGRNDIKNMMRLLSSAYQIEHKRAHSST
jgi:hypothetical protein